MSFLVISDEQKARVHELALFCARPENWYAPETCPVPGDGDKHTLQLDSYRCVFTLTVCQGRLFRHLSISVRASSTGRYPSPIAVYTIAALFGFTGGVEHPDAPPGLGVMIDAGWDWQCGPLDTPIPHVVVAQEIGPASLGASRGPASASDQPAA